LLQNSSAVYFLLVKNIHFLQAKIDKRPNKMKLQLAKQLRKPNLRFTFLSGEKFSFPGRLRVFYPLGPSFLLADTQPAAAADTAATLILPLKINTPDNKKNLTETADAALVKVLGTGSARQKGFKFMPRTEAENIFDYGAAWPPNHKKLKEFASQSAPSIHYIAAGS